MNEWPNIAIFHPETSEILKAMRFLEMLNLQLVEYSKRTPGEIVSLLDPCATTDQHTFEGGPTVTGTTGRDTMYPGEQFNTVTFVGSPGADVINGSTRSQRNTDSTVDYSGSTGWIRIDVVAADPLRQIGFGGFAHGDTLVSMHHIIASRYNDAIDGNGYDNYYRGLAGNDTLRGNVGNDTLDGGAGNDSLLGGSLNDRLRGGDNDDTLNGGAADDGLYGGAGNDVLRGQGGSDVLWGEAGDDILAGSSDDHLSGGIGRDALSAVGQTTLNGGLHADVFTIAAGTAAVLQDFEIGVDDLVLGARGASFGVASYAELTRYMRQTAQGVTIDFTGTYTVHAEINGPGVTIASLQADVTIF